MKKINKMNKIVALLMAVILMTGMLSGCGGKQTGKKEEGNSATDVEISYWRSGLGVEWLDAVIEAFNEKNPEYKVYYTDTASETAVTKSFGMENIDTVDLYLAQKQYSTTYLEPLNDVLDATVKGESKSIKEKFDQSYLKMEELDGNYYNLTYGGGILGFVYNKKLFQEAGITQIPRTTDELSVVCATLKDENIVPLCHFDQSGYYHWMQEAWFSQYNGFEYYQDFYQNPSKEKMLTDDGRYEVLKAMEKFITPEYVLAGSVSSKHTIIQTKFLEGSAAMMVNGSWLSSEMSQSDDKINNFEMMKTPVISAITDKLTTVKNDSELRKLITAIDKVTDGEENIETYKDGENYLVDGKNIAAADWDYVRAARNTVPSNYASETCFIPTYSNAKEGAKEFLKFLYSDEGYQIYLNTLHISLPLSLDKGEIKTEGWNAFEANQCDLFDKAEFNVATSIMSKHPIFIAGGATAYADTIFTHLFCAQNQNDRISADEAWTRVKNKINDKYDKTWLLNIK